MLVAHYITETITIEEYFLFILGLFTIGLALHLIKLFLEKVDY